MREIGARYETSGGCSFCVWAPAARSLSLRIVYPDDRIVPMTRDAGGYWTTTLMPASPGLRYFYRIDNDRERPDPASAFQPLSVHGPSEAVDHRTFPWDDGAWRGMPLSEMVIYEIHIGTFTPGGTFSEVIPRLPDLKDLGINTIELMPVAQFPGERNWGYDGACPFAVQNSYGGPRGLKELVNECHRIGIAVILDVVYNHLGPEGNYLWDYGPYFTDRYRTPWGSAVNFDGPDSDGVRHFFIENALSWFEHYHIDALRLDAVHAVCDMSAKHFLRDLAEEVHGYELARRRTYHLIAESDLNDARIISPPEIGGYGLDAQWCEDFHHALHALLTGEEEGYYEDFGGITPLVASLKDGYVYKGQYSPYRRRRHGNSPEGRRAEQFIVFSQNHDQTGNRMLGERLAGLVPFESLKLAAGAVILSPYIPMLFMGEEYGETNPFLYFVSHSDPDLINAVRKGRAAEFASFWWSGAVPDPQDAETFLRSKLMWERREQREGAVLLDFYRQLIRLRRSHPVLSVPDRDNINVCGFEDSGVVTLLRRSKDWDDEVLIIFHFGDGDVTLPHCLSGASWHRILDSAEERFGGPGTVSSEMVSPGSPVMMRPRSFVVYEQEATL